MAKPNYQHARRQRELARKARQQEKLQRRSARTGTAADGEPAEPALGSGNPTRDPTPGSGA